MYLALIKHAGDDKLILRSITPGSMVQGAEIQRDHETFNIAPPILTLSVHILWSRLQAGRGSFTRYSQIKHRLVSHTQAQPTVAM